MRRKIYAYLVALILAIAILGAPSEGRFLTRLKRDYGMMHTTPLSQSDLRKIGSSNYASYLLWSTYEYTFGTIKVNYFGIAFMTFYLGSSRESPLEDEPQQPISSL